MREPTPVITRDMIDCTTESQEPNLIEEVTVTYKGKRYLIEIVPDTDSTPFDAECYSEEDIEGWRNDQWWYVSIIVTPLDVPGSRQFELSDSLSGLEYDFPLNPPQEINGRRYTRTNTEYQVIHYPVSDMISEVISLVKAYDLQTAIDSYINS